MGGLRGFNRAAWPSWRRSPCTGGWETRTRCPGRSTVSARRPPSIPVSRWPTTGLGWRCSNDGQPLAAAEALRASLKANPGFVPAMVALASVLYSSEDDRKPLFGFRRPPRDMGPPKLQEARRLWQSVISVASGASSLDRAAAWAGLCRHALDEPDRAAPGTGGTQCPASTTRRIAVLSDRVLLLPAGRAALCGSRDDPPGDLRVKTARASELAAIGMLLERHGPGAARAGRRRAGSARGPIDENALASDGRTVKHRVPRGYYTRARPSDITAGPSSPAR